MARETKITVSGAAPVDALRAITDVVFATEQKYAINGEYNADTNPNGVADITTKEKVATGANPNELHVFTLTQDISAGTYTFAYKATYANIEEKKAADASATE